MLAMYAVATTESGAYALSGVLMDKAGNNCRARATDGRVLIDVTWPGDDPGSDFPETIVPREQVEHAARHVGDVDVSRDGSAVTVEGVTGDSMRMRLGAAARDKKFPNTEDIIPMYGPDEATSIRVDPSRLADVARILAKLIEPHRPACKAMVLTIPKNPNRPLVLDIKTPGGLKARAALMPVKM